MVAINIADYSTEVSQGVGRRNRYLIEIDGMPTSMKFFIRGAQTPSVTANPLSLFCFGREKKLRGEWRTASYNLTVYGIVQADSMVASAEFQKWMDTCNGIDTNISPSLISDYERSVRITCYHDDGVTVISEWLLQDAFPSQIQPVDLNFESEDPIEFNLVLEFSQYSAKSGADVIFGDI